MTPNPPDASPEPWTFSANGVLEALTWAQAVDALQSTLADGFDPETDPDRHSIDAAGGHMLLMPSSTGQRLGVKVLTVRNGPDATDSLPTIQGAYVLFDGDSMAPLAFLDGAALTKVRTAATSALAIRHLADRPLPRLAVFGTGAQAHGHASALHATAGVEHVDVVARDSAKGEAFVRQLRSEGIPASLATPAAVSAADIIACTSSAGAPLFSGDAVKDHALVLAIGSHTPTTRDIDSTLVSRGSVVVESRHSAQREAGAVLIPQSENLLYVRDLPTLSDIVQGRYAVSAGTGPRIFVGTGMAWQDLSIAGAVFAEAQKQMPGFTSPEYLQPGPTTNASRDTARYRIERSPLGFHSDRDTFASPATAHLGQARRAGEGEWVAVDNYGRPVATIWSPYLGRPNTFRCDPLPHARYVDAVEADDFSVVLDYALNNFSTAL
ncbi:ornithine cyclodeaminase family protein [Arthrobacter sp. MW3 TE3886]|uniref:ornithine cyclodeaminase family protein n=1 Tax=Arthrobacter sp. MW3 TE3886 TaxID=3156254 RepID=UPI003517DBDB